MNRNDVMRLAHDAARGSHPSSSRTDVATNVIGALFGAGAFDRSDLTAPGDLMQSSASRVLDALERVERGQAPGYEARMAALELRSAINDWTEARR